MKEALKLALEALEWSKPHEGAVLTYGAAIAAIKEALAQPEQPKVRTGDCLLVGVCASEGHKIQAQQEPWCMKMNGCKTKCEDCPVEVAEPQPEERNFCPRCGKRTADLTVIHTCTPPQENT